MNFQLDADGDVTSGTFHDQDGQTASIARHRHQVTLADEVLDRYVGTYNVAGTDATITRSAEGLTAALPDGAVQLYPETTTRFFVKEVDAQVLFQVDGDDIRRGRSSTRPVRIRSRSRSHAERAWQTSLPCPGMTATCRREVIG